MKFRMYALVMFKGMTKTVANVITFILAVPFCITFGFCVYCCYLKDWDSIVILLAFKLTICLFYVSLVGKPMDYVEVCKESVKVVYWLPFFKKEKIVQFSQIYKAYIEPVRVKGAGLMPEKLRPYQIRFENENGKRLFTVHYTDEAYNTFKNYIVNYEEYLKRIEE